jgi:hypothetical protein
MHSTLAEHTLLGCVSFYSLLGVARNRFLKLVLNVHRRVYLSVEQTIANGEFELQYRPFTSGSAHRPDELLKVFRLCLLFVDNKIGANAALWRCALLKQVSLMVLVSPSPRQCQTTGAPSPFPFWGG